MKILKHTPPTITVEDDKGNVVIHNLDTIRQRVLKGSEKATEILKAFIFFRVENRGKE